MCTSVPEVEWGRPVCVCVCMGAYSEWCAHGAIPRAITCSVSMQRDEMMSERHDLGMCRHQRHSERVANVHSMCLEWYWVCARCVPEGCKSDIKHASARRLQHEYAMRYDRTDGDRSVRGWCTLRMDVLSAGNGREVIEVVMWHISVRCVNGRQ